VERRVAFQWQWDGELKENEYFDIRVWKMGNQEHSGVAWTKETTHQYDMSEKGGGQYEWTVVVIRGRDGKLEQELSPEAAIRNFTCNLPSPDGPEPP
jgi:hypothetical protein